MREIRASLDTYEARKKVLEEFPLDIVVQAMTAMGDDEQPPQ